MSEVMTQADEVAALRRRAEVAEAEAAHWKKVVEWYAHPEQWTELHDGRGRGTFTFRWGDDGGWVAKQALKKWGANGAD